MSDSKKTTTNKSPKNPTNNPGNSQVPFTIHAQYLKDFSFENPTPLTSFNNQDADNKHEIGVNVEVEAEQVGENLFEVVLLVNVEAKNDENRLFIVEISYAGLVNVNDLTAKKLEGVLMVDCPILLFPFVRQLIADATRQGGYPPLMLEPVNFAELYQTQGKKPQPETLN